MKKASLLLIGLFFFAGAWAQDAAFMNKHLSWVYLNPSFAGSNGYIRNQTVYRNQWPNLSGTFVTYNNTIDAYIKPIKGGLALSVMSDDCGRGTTRTTGIALSYAQYIKLSEYIKIIPSIQGSYNQITLDKGRLNYGDLIYYRTGQVWNTPNYVPVASKKYSDLATGLLLDLKGAYLGVSCSNILEPDVSLLPDQKINLPIRTMMHASWNIHLDPRHTSNFLCVFSNQGQFQQFSIRMINTINQRILYGVGYGTRSELQAYLGLRMRALTISYSYDANVSKLMGNTAGSHEIGMSFSFKKKGDNYKTFIEQR